MVICPFCKTEHAEGSLACNNCGHLLPIETAADPQLKTQNIDLPITKAHLPHWGTTYFDSYRSLLVHIVGTDQVLELDLHRPGGIVLGRMDPATPESPELNLTPFGAREAGVSRRHAQLSLTYQSMYITDLRSSNSTFVNGVKLDPYVARILRDGDRVNLGRLSLQMIFSDDGKAPEDADGAVMTQAADTAQGIQT